VSRSPEIKLWKAKDTAFDIGAGMVALGIILVLLMGQWLDVFGPFDLKPDVVPWKALVVSVMMMIPYKVGRRIVIGKPPIANQE
jgi:hypothetical protein